MNRTSAQPKIIIALLLATMLTLTLVGCGEPDAGDDNAIDYDFVDSRRSDLINYGILSDMLSEPHNYEGSSIRIRGTYSVYFNQWLERERHMLLYDGPACQCPQRLEFKWANNDMVLPEPDTEFEIIGVFGTYEEAGYENLRYVMVDELILL
jgi:hypothetical protein